MDGDCRSCNFYQRQAENSENFYKELQVLMQGQQDVMAKQSEKIDKYGRRIERLLLKINKLRREKEGATKPFEAKKLDKKKFLSEGKSSVQREEKDTFGYFKEVEAQAKATFERKTAENKAALEAKFKDEMLKHNMEAKFKDEMLKHNMHRYRKQIYESHQENKKKRGVLSRVKRVLGITKATPRSLSILLTPKKQEEPLKS